MNLQSENNFGELLSRAQFFKLKTVITKFGLPIKKLDQISLERLITEISLENLFSFDSIAIAIYIDINIAIFIITLAIENSKNPLLYKSILELCITAKSRNEIDALLFIKIYEFIGLQGDAHIYISDLNQRIRDSDNLPEDVRAYSQLLIEHQEWARAFELLKLIELSSENLNYKWMYSNLSLCAHMLGRFSEAEHFTWKGLGDEANLITHKSEIKSEKQIIANWQDNNTSPLVSIFCVSYNHARYIELAIKGFLLQETKYSYEIIIHDDASTDGTQALINKWQLKYPNIIKSIIQEKNIFSQGKDAFEIMSRVAKGKFIALCDGDDYWLDTSKLQKQVNFLESNPTFSCCAHNHYTLEEKTLNVKRWIIESQDLVLSPRELKNLTRLLWIPTLVFRNIFQELPYEKKFATLFDSFLTSYLGVFGSCMYFQNYLGSVRRLNQFSVWTPMHDSDKEKSRIRTRFALVRMHERLGDYVAAADLLLKIDASSLDKKFKHEISQQSLTFLSNLNVNTPHPDGNPPLMTCA